VNIMRRININFGLRYLPALTAVILSMTQMQAQDPLKTLPQAYKLQFENEWVKVSRVHYAPHEKLPPHQHTLSASAYVYLNDSGPVVFKHLDLPYGAVTRQPTKDGTFRLYQGLKEIHEVENLSDLPSDFLRIEFKTEPLNEKSLRGRFHRETYPAGENFQKVQFENEQIRITRLVCAQGKTLQFAKNPAEPFLLIALTPSNFVMSVKGKATKLALDKGQNLWLTSGEQERLLTAGSQPIELLRFDFKTKPLSKEMLEADKKHQHSEK